MYFCFAFYFSQIPGALEVFEHNMEMVCEASSVSLSPRTAGCAGSPAHVLEWDPSFAFLNLGDLHMKAITAWFCFPT